MIVFACDSSGRSASAAIIKDSEVIAKELVNEGLTHSEMLMPLCDRVFNKSGLTPSDIDFFAVSCGPGSFTGLRIGIGTIKGMAMASQKQCIAVPTLEALAFSAACTNYTVIPVCDARRNRVFCSSFIWDSGLKRITSDTVLDVRELPSLFGNTGNLFVGDAAEICYNSFRDRYDVSFGDLYVDAENVALVALRYISENKTVSADSLNPFYLQLSQAERELSKKRKE